MFRFRRLGIGCVLIALAGALLAPAAQAQVEADGNDITAPAREAFRPAEYSANVGQVVRWRNIDSLAPHTAVEDHMLWDLRGSRYGAPLVQPGFGPGETVERPFEAGTHNYFCAVHPRTMRGTVSVPAELTLRRVGKPGARKRLVMVRWAAEPPASGFGFDAQRKRGNGDWVTFASGSTAAEGSFSAGKKRRGRKTGWQVRVRLRASDSDVRATDWSPPASIQS